MFDPLGEMWYNKTCQEGITRPVGILKNREKSENQDKKSRVVSSKSDILRFVKYLEF